MRIRDLVGRELKWAQPSATKRRFELQADGEIAATLSFRSMLGSFATAETAAGSWTFKRQGFWRTYVTVREAASEKEVAMFRNNVWSDGGALILADGLQFLATTNFWNSKYEFLTEAREPLVKFRKIGGVVRLSSRLEIMPAAAKVAELPLLVTLGWYLAVKMHDDGAAMAAGAAVASA